MRRRRDPGRNGRRWRGSGRSGRNRGFRDGARLACRRGPRSGRCRGHLHGDGLTGGGRHRSIEGQRRLADFETGRRGANGSRPGHGGTRRTNRQLARDLRLDVPDRIGRARSGRRDRGRARRVGIGSGIAVAHIGERDADPVDRREQRSASSRGRDLRRRGGDGRPDRSALPVAVLDDGMDRRLLVEPSRGIDMRGEHDPQHLLAGTRGIGSGDLLPAPRGRSRRIWTGGRRLRLGRIAEDQRERAIVDDRTRRADAVGRAAGEIALHGAPHRHAARKQRAGEDRGERVRPRAHDAFPASQAARNSFGR